MDGNRRYAIIRLVFPSRISICCRHFSSPDRPVVPVTRHDKEITATAISIHPSRISVLFINDAALLIAPGLNLAAYWYKVYRSNCELAARLQQKGILSFLDPILQFYTVEIKQGIFFLFLFFFIASAVLLAEFKYFKRCFEKSRLNIDQFEKKPIRVNKSFTARSTYVTHRLNNKIKKENNPSEMKFAFPFQNFSYELEVLSFLITIIPPLHAGLNQVP